MTFNSITPRSRRRSRWEPRRCCCWRVPRAPPRKADGRTRHVHLLTVLDRERDGLRAARCPAINVFVEGGSHRD